MLTRVEVLAEGAGDADRRPGITLQIGGHPNRYGQYMDQIVGGKVLTIPPPGATIVRRAISWIELPTYIDSILEPAH